MHHRGEHLGEDHAFHPVIVEDYSLRVQLDQNLAPVEIQSLSQDSRVPECFWTLPSDAYVPSEVSAEEDGVQITKGLDGEIGPPGTMTCVVQHGE